MRHRSHALRLESLESRVVLSTTPTLVADFDQSPTAPSATGFVQPFGDQIAWIARTLTGSELYLADPSGGASLVRQFSWPTDGYANFVGEFGDSILVNGSRGRVEANLWSLNEGVPTRLSDFTPGTFVVSGESIYVRENIFDEQAGDFTTEVSIVDSSSEEPVTLPGATVVATSIGDSLVAVTVVGSSTGNASDQRLQVWAVEGSESRALADVSITSTFVSLGTEPLLVNDRMLFMVETAELGDELWTTDGTVEGTGLLRDFREGPEGQDFRLLLTTPSGDRARAANAGLGTATHHVGFGRHDGRYDPGAG